MDRDIVRAGCNRLIDIPLRFHHHQVTFLRNGAKLPCRLHDAKVQGKVRNKLPVHDVDMQKVDLSRNA